MEFLQGNQAHWLYLNNESMKLGLNHTSEMNFYRYDEMRAYIELFRKQYRIDWSSDNMLIRQLGTAVYFIDKFKMRVGNDKDATIGCCSLRVIHLTLSKKGPNYMVNFNVMGVDKTYRQKRSVNNLVYQNLKVFMQNKKFTDKLFDKLNVAILNKFLNEIVDQVTKKLRPTGMIVLTKMEKKRKTIGENINITRDKLTKLEAQFQKMTKEIADKRKKQLRGQKKNKNDQTNTDEKSLGIRQSIMNSGHIDDEVCCTHILVFKSEIKFDTLENSSHSSPLSSENKIKETVHLSARNDDLPMDEVSLAIRLQNMKREPSDDSFNLTAVKKFKREMQVETVEKPATSSFLSSQIKIEQVSIKTECLDE